MPVGDPTDATKNEEYENNPELKSEDLIRLREWTSSQKHLPEIEDEMLVRFHHSCYYELDRTKDCIEAYYTIRSSSPQLFTNRDITSPELVEALGGWHSTLMPVTDARGYRFIYGAIKDPDPSKFFHTESLKTMLMTIDSCLARHGTAPGVVIVVNMQELKLGHLMRMSLPSLRKFTIYNQEANPIRLKEIHMVNVVSWIDRVLLLMKPFLKKEMLNLVRFHKSNSETLFEHLPRECVPEDIGGTLPPAAVLHAEDLKYIENMKEFFAKEENSRIDESKRDKKKKKKEPEPEPETTLKNLEID